MKRHLWLPLSLAVALIPTAAHASQPAGVWVKVQSVGLEPDATAPARIRIYGAVLLYKGAAASGEYLDSYTEPALGYMYYQCPSGDAATCLSEWNDVQANVAAPLEICVGLGDQSMPTGTLRATSAAPNNPDPYPIAMGVLTGYTPCQALADFLKTQPDAGTGAGGTSAAGGTNNSGGTVPAKGGSTSAGGSSGAGGRTSPGNPPQGSGGRTGSGGESGGDGGHAGGKPENGGGPAENGGTVASAGGAAKDDPDVEKPVARTIPADEGCSVTKGPTPGRSGWEGLIAIAVGWALRRRNRGT